MADRGKSEGIIQDAILIGAPCSGSLDTWKKFTRVVAGRIVNGYCKYVNSKIPLCIIDKAIKIVKRFSSCNLILKTVFY